jgi:hypothetical protein
MGTPSNHKLILIDPLLTPKFSQASPTSETDAKPGECGCGGKAVEVSYQRTFSCSVSQKRIFSTGMSDY